MAAVSLVFPPQAAQGWLCEIMAALGVDIDNIPAYRRVLAEDEVKVKRKRKPQGGTCASYSRSVHTDLTSSLLK